MKHRHRNGDRYLPVRLYRYDPPGNGAEFGYVYSAQLYSSSDKAFVAGAMAHGDDFVLFVIRDGNAVALLEHTGHVRSTEVAEHHDRLCWVWGGEPTCHV